MKKLFYLFCILLLSTTLCSCLGERKTKEAKSHYLLGIAHLKDNKPTLALQEFLYAEEANPRDAEIHAALGQSYHIKKSYQDAEKHYLRALDLDEGNPRIQNNLAALYSDMQKWDDAIHYFDLAASNILFGAPEVALTGMGYAYYKKGDHLPAVSSFQKALEQKKNYPLAHYYLGEVYSALGKTRLAIGEYRAALNNFPNYVSAHFRLGLTYMKERETDKAVAAFNEVVRLSPDSESGKEAQKYISLLK